MTIVTPLASPAYRGQLLPLALATSLLVVGCGGSEPTNTTAMTTPQTSTVLLTTTSSTTPAPPRGPAGDEILEVAFDGSVCTTIGPAVVPTGVHSFLLKDLTGEGLADVRTMAVSEGYTYEDLLDLQSEPGEYVPLPEWADWPLTTFEPIDRELDENEIGKRLILEPGVHGIVVGTGKGLWFCGQLTVTDS